MISIQVEASQKLLCEMYSPCFTCNGKGTYFNPNSLSPYGPCSACDGRGYFK